MFFLKDLPVTGQTVTDNSQVSVWLLSFRVFFISFWSNFKLTESLVTCQHLHVRDVHVVAVTEPTTHKGAENLSARHIISCLNVLLSLIL